MINQLQNSCDGPRRRAHCLHLYWQQFQTLGPPYQQRINPCSVFLPLSIWVDFSTNPGRVSCRSLERPVHPVQRMVLAGKVLCSTVFRSGLGSMGCCRACSAVKDSDYDIFGSQGFCTSSIMITSTSFWAAMAALYSVCTDRLFDRPALLPITNIIRCM